MPTYCFSVHFPASCSVLSLEERVLHHNSQRYSLTPTPLKLHHHSKTPLGIHLFEEFDLVNHLSWNFLLHWFVYNPSLLVVSPPPWLLSLLLWQAAFLVPTIKTLVFPGHWPWPFSLPLLNASLILILPMTVDDLISLPLGLTIPLNYLLDTSTWMCYRPSNLMCPKLCSLYPVYNLPPINILVNGTALQPPNLETWQSAKPLPFPPVGNELGLGLQQRQR